MDEDKEEKVGLKFNKCSHVESIETYWYKAIVIDNTSWLLCRSCYGSVLTQVLDELKRIEIRLR